MDKEYFIENVVCHRAKLLAYATKMMKNSYDAEDVLQEVFIKLWVLRENLVKYNSVYAFSLQVTKNLCIDKLRVGKPRNKRDEEGQTIRKPYFVNGTVEIIDEASTPIESLTNKDNLKTVSKIMEDLPEVQKLILKMRHVDELEISEIAEILGCTNEYVRVNISRGRKRVREAFFSV